MPFQAGDLLELEFRFGVGGPEPGAAVVGLGVFRVETDEGLEASRSHRLCHRLQAIEMPALRTLAERRGCRAEAM